MNASAARNIRVIVAAALIAGTLDIGAAALISMVSPLTILRAVASGLLGKAAFQGGLPVAALGLLLQWAMTALIAAIYIVVVGSVRALRMHWLAAGLIYGVIVFAVMNYVVVPASAMFADHHFPHFTPTTFIANGLAMLLYGAIIAFLARNVVAAAARAQPSDDTTARREY